MDPLSITAGVVGLITFAGTVISKGYQLLSTIKVSRHNVTELLDSLSTLTGILTAFKAQYNTNTSPPSSSTSQASIAGLLASSVVDCERTVKSVEQILDKIQKCRTLVLAAKLNAMKLEIDNLLQEIDRHKQIFILSLGLDTKRTTSDIQTLQQTIADQIKDVKLEIQKTHHETQRQRELEKRQKIIEWLKPKGVERFEKAQRLAVSGSGLWVLDSPEFNDWRTTNSNILWLEGIAGSGKTVLTASIVQHLLQTAKSNTNTAISVAYFFCNYAQAKVEDPTEVLNTLIAHMLRDTREVTKSPASQFFHEADDGTRTLSLGRAEDLIVALAHEHDKVYIVLDALDELTGKSELLQSLIHLLTRSSKIKVLISCRPADLEIGEMLEGCPKISLTADKVRADIDLYIKHRIDCGPARLKALERAPLENELIRRADGMFLWVTCQLDTLSRPSRHRDIEQALQRLPAGLFATYDRILNTIDPEYLDLASRSLFWLAHAPASMNLDELVEVIAIELDSTSTDGLERLHDPADILRLCGSLLRHSDTTNIVELAHHSVFEFVNSSWDRQEIPEAFRITEDKALMTMSRTILRFLNFLEFRVSRIEPYFDAKSIRLHEIIPSQSSRSFFTYATMNWWKVLPKDSSMLSDLWSDILAFFDDETGNFAAIILVLRHAYGDYRYPTLMKPVHFCAMHGLEFVKYLTPFQHFDIQATVDDGRTALHIAVENSNESMVRHLVVAGAHIDAVSYDGRTPLQCALEIGHIDITRYLVKEGADVKGCFVNGESALSMAVNNGMHELITFLLAEKLDPNERLPDGKTALHIAAQVGSDFVIVDLLRNAGADVLLGDLNAWTPLHYAAHHGHAETLLLLLADDDVPTSKAKGRSDGDVLGIFQRPGWTPLHAAIEQEHLQVVELLSSYSSTVSEVCAIASSDSFSPLEQWRSRRLLLSRPSGSTGKFSGTAARPASFSDTFDLEYDAPAPSARGLPRAEGFRTKPVPSPLWLATNQAFLSGIAVLTGAGVCKQDTENCLKLAVNIGTADCLQALVAQSTEAFRTLLNLRKEGLSTAVSDQVVEELCGRSWDIEDLKQILISLIETDDLPCLSTLLSSNFGTTKVSPKGFTFDSILDEVMFQTIEMDKAIQLKLLMNFSKNSNVTFKSPAPWSFVGGDSVDGCTLLQFAIYRYRTDIVSQLISCEISLHATDERGRSPLHYAAQYYLKEIMDLLLRKSARVDMADCDALTPLHLACHFGQTEAVRSLLQARANVHTLDNKGRTALHHWGYKPEPEVHELLLVHGADAAAVDADRLTALELAVVSAFDQNLPATSINVWTLLKNDPGLIYRKLGKQQRTLLHYAAEAGADANVISGLIAQGADREAEDLNGHTAMQVAARPDDLIRRGARWKLPARGHKSQQETAGQAPSAKRLRVTLVPE